MNCNTILVVLEKVIFSKNMSGDHFKMIFAHVLIYKAAVVVKIAREDPL